MIATKPDTVAQILHASRRVRRESRVFDFVTRAGRGGNVRHSFEVAGGARQSAASEVYEVKIVFLWLRGIV